MDKIKGKVPDYILAVMCKNNMEMLTEKERTIARRLAARLPVNVTEEELFKLFHNFDFTDYLIGVLPDQPFDEYKNDPRLKSGNYKYWRSIFINDAAAVLRDKIYGHMTDEELDPEVFNSPDTIEII